MQKPQRPKKAIALQYKSGDDHAPCVTAKGTGRLAERIIEMARKHGIPVKDDPDLVEVLSRLDLDDEIPPGLYVVVAELLAFVYCLNKKKGSK
jgi:flagellar biosynthesis protein